MKWMSANLWKCFGGENVFYFVFQTKKIPIFLGSCNCTESGIGRNDSTLLKKVFFAPQKSSQLSPSATFLVGFTHSNVLISFCLSFQFRRLAMLRIICTTSARSMKMANFGKWLRMSQRGIRTEHPHTFILIVESVVCWLVTDFEFKNWEGVGSWKRSKRRRRIWERERGEANAAPVSFRRATL